MNTDGNGFQLLDTDIPVKAFMVQLPTIRSACPDYARDWESLLQIIKVVPHGTAVGARNLVLV